MKNLLAIALLVCLATPLTAAEQDLIWKDGKWVRQAAPAKGTPAGEVALIRQKIDRKKYRSAVKAAKKFLKRYPTDPLREEVLGLAGEAEMYRKRYWQAYEWYEKQLTRFPNGAGFEQALAREMEIAEAFLAGKKRRVLGIFRLSAEQEGIDILRRIAEHAPATPQAEMALLTIGDHYFNKGKWQLAAEAYGQFLTLLPKSPRSPRAELARAAAMIRSYRGPLWDETPLIEAEQHYKTFVTHHPAEARKAQVQRILKEIRSARAEKQYEIGRFYLRTDKPDSAAYYFRLIVKKYPDTEWAKRAKAELAKLGKADQPVKPAGNTGQEPAPQTRPAGGTGAKPVPETRKEDKQ